jgi:hypothetical protein
MIKTINIFEAGAAYRSAHNLAISTEAFTRNYGNPYYASIRQTCKAAQSKFEQGLSQIKSRALMPDYVDSL